MKIRSCINSKSPVSLVDGMGALLTVVNLARRNLNGSVPANRTFLHKKVREMRFTGN
jgi:hypothetical protein